MSNISQIALICCRILTGSLLRKHLLQSRWDNPLSKAELRQKIYLNNYPWQSRLPDHVFDLGFKAANEQGIQDGQLASNSLRALAEKYLSVEHGRVQVQIKSFGEWQQSVISRVSCMPVMAAARAIHSRRGGSMFHVSKPNKCEPLPCITPFDGAVEDYISREGLHESHLHLNGSTYAEQCWLRAIAYPDREVKKFSSLWHGTGDNSSRIKVEELASLSDINFSPSDLKRNLKYAGELRNWLINFALHPRESISLPLHVKELCRGRQIAPSPAKEFNPRYAQMNEVLSAEVEWMERLLSSDYIPHQVDRMLHLYLLVQHQFRALMVQGEELYGFDQFQKITHTELRSVAEQSYLQRFTDSHGGNTKFSQIAYLEGRFAPKTKAIENVQLLKSILLDYAEYLKNKSGSKIRINKHSLGGVLVALEEMTVDANARWPRCQQLALVAHFIKDDWDYKKGGPYRHYKLRCKLDRQMDQLRITLKDYPKLHRWVRGVDAAANELHAPPEVFASVFRQSVLAGVGHRSFHVGEDFPHLLTGIRSIYDALELLNLGEGARIGHGTAIGISPSLWLSRMPSSLHLKSGDRLLDLLVSWQLMREVVDTTVQAYQIEVEINKLIQNIFRRDISSHLFERAMKLRHLHMGFVAESQSSCKWSWKHASLVDGLREEARLVMLAKERDEEALSLLWEWHSDPRIWERSEKLLLVQSTDSIFTENIYIKLQQAVMKDISSRKVIIEALPSSNVRISQYERFEEHHVMRWMGVPGCGYEGDPRMMVSLGSDDPGIFSGNLKGEFYQIYSAIKNLGHSDSDALRYIGDINERGRQYRFHDPLL